MPGEWYGKPRYYVLWGWHFDQEPFPKYITRDQKRKETARRARAAREEEHHPLGFLPEEGGTEYLRESLPDLVRLAGPDDFYDQPPTTIQRRTIEMDLDKWMSKSKRGKRLPNRNP